MRLGRLAVETVTDSIPGYKFELGKGATLRDGTDVTIIAVGMNVQMALAAADKLAAEGVPPASSICTPSSRSTPSWF